MYFKRANVIKYRDSTNTENKVQLKDLCKFIQTILYKISQRNVNGFYSSSVSVSSLVFRFGKAWCWKVFALRANLFGVSKAFLSGEKHYCKSNRLIAEYDK